MTHVPLCWQRVMWISTWLSYSSTYICWFLFEKGANWQLRFHCKQKHKSNLEKLNTPYLSAGQGQSVAVAGGHEPCAVPRWSWTGSRGTQTHLLPTKQSSCHKVRILTGWLAGSDDWQYQSSGQTAVYKYIFFHQYLKERSIFIKWRKIKCTVSVLCNIPHHFNWISSFSTG